MTVRGDRRLQATLRDLTTTLNATGAGWMVIGGIAAIARGVRRFTADIDATIRGDEVTIDELLAALAKQSITPRIEGAADFARENLVLLVRHASSGVEIDLTLAWTEFERDAIAAATIAAFGTCACQAQSNLVHKTLGAEQSTRAHRMAWSAIGTAGRHRK